MAASGPAIWLSFSSFFLILELVVHALIKRQIALDRDLPMVRRYANALIETSVPTAALALHINSMGSVEALGFVVPLTYFIFIILSTLRMDFWLSTFTGLVAAVELFAMAMWYHPDGAPDPTYHLLRSMIIFIGGVLAGAVGLLVRHPASRPASPPSLRPRPGDQPVRSARLAAGGRAPAGGGTLTRSDIRRVAVMFVDFRSFTAAAKARTPQEVVDRLDGAFAVLVDILDRHGGIVNKFLGDGFLALFGAPLETEDATRHAVDAPARC